MDREQLMSEVKDEYAKLADFATRESYADVTDHGMGSEQYYETLLQDVLHAIQDGHFDQYSSGLEIVEAVANDKSVLYG